MMRADSPRWEEVNPSPFEHERAGLCDAEDAVHQWMTLVARA
jgi:hypothetical protein